MQCFASCRQPLAGVTSKLWAVRPAFPVRLLSTHDDSNKSYQLLIVGGGSGGIGLAAYFSRKLGPGKVAVVEPNTVHTFQPLWTLVGGGLTSLNNATRPTDTLLHKDCTWIKDKVHAFEPASNTVFTDAGRKIKYDYLVVAMGIIPRLDMVEGLEDALETPGVCSVYFPKYAEKTYETVQTIQSGELVFTYPHTPIKCAGAPQKIMYLTDSNLRKMGKRDEFHFNYNSALGVMFSVPHYAKTMVKIANGRGMDINFFHKLIAVDPAKRVAKFEVGSGDDEKKTKEFKYDMLHVSPPHSPPEALMQCKELVCNDGYLQIDPFTLQHVKYANIYGIGDCTSLPTSKTLAAITTQGKVIRRRLLPILENKESSSSNATYNGYSSCPLITSRNSVVMAEFGYDGKLMETFPFDQNKETHSLFYVATRMMPFLYWQLHVRGFWEGPSFIRRIFHPFST